MKSYVRFALIGAGGFGAFHLAALAALEKIGAAKLVAIVEPNDQCRQKLSEQFGSASFYRHYAEMLYTEKEIDAVVIAAPIPLHYEMVKACLKYDVFIYLEKPPLPLLHQLEEIVALDEDLRVSVGFQMVGSMWAQQLKRWVVEGKLGQIQEIRTCACWPRPKSYYQRSAWAGRMTYLGQPVFDGPATNALSHLIHNVMYLGSAMPDAFEEPVDIQGELYRARPLDGYDVSNILGRFRSGIRFSATLAHASTTMIPYKLEITGSKGRARVSGDGSILESNFGVTDTAEKFADLMLKSYGTFIDYIRGRRERPLTSLQDCRPYTLATNAMLLSSGGIHAIGQQWTQRRDSERDESFEVLGLDKLIENVFCRPSVFAEHKVPWAVKPQLITGVNSMTSDSFQADRFFQESAGFSNQNSIQSEEVTA